MKKPKYFVVALLCVSSSAFSMSPSETRQKRDFLFLEEHGGTQLSFSKRVKELETTPGFDDTWQRFCTSDTESRKGYRHELDTALHLLSRKARIRALNHTIQSSTGLTREFDIIASSSDEEDETELWIECKAVRWKYFKKYHQLLEQKQIAEEIAQREGRPITFCVYSKTPLNPAAQKFLHEHGIECIIFTGK